MGTFHISMYFLNKGRFISINLIILWFPPFLGNKVNLQKLKFSFLKVHHLVNHWVGLLSPCLTKQRLLITIRLSQWLSHTWPQCLPVQKGTNCFSALSLLSAHAAPSFSPLSPFLLCTDHSHSFYLQDSFFQQAPHSQLPFAIFEKHVCNNVKMLNVSRQSASKDQKLLPLE